MDIPKRGRHLVSTALALLLAVESVSAVAAAAQVTVTQRSQAPQAPAGDQVVAAQATASTGAVPAASASVRVRVPDAGLIERPVASTAAADAPAVPMEKPPRPDAPQVPARMAPAPTAAPPPRASSSSGATRYSGRNHVWIPSLGISRSVTSFPCDRSRPPDNAVYRWGCAGANNVYLFGHAYSVFKPLHDAYVGHRLKVGMKVYYADGRGTVHTYAVKWWKLTAPTTAASWAWAAQSTPSMTLQTCVGANSEYRLMVRLTEVDG